MIVISRNPHEQVVNYPDPYIMVQGLASKAWPCLVHGAELLLLLTDLLRHLAAAEE